MNLFLEPSLPSHGRFGVSTPVSPRVYLFHVSVLKVIRRIHYIDPYETGTNGIAPATEIAAALTVSSMLPKNLHIVVSHPIYKQYSTKKLRRCLAKGFAPPKGTTIAEIDLMVVDEENCVHEIYEIKSAMTIRATFKSIIQLRRVASLLNNGEISGYKPSPNGVVYKTLFLHGKTAKKHSGMFFRQYTLSDAAFSLPDEVFVIPNI